MPLFKFENFIFDSTSHQLTNKGEKVALRPKTLKLLNLLIENRHRLVSKAEIMSSVWGSDYARDHLLFQLISELRRHPLNSEFVRTQPNEGYQWNISTRVIENRIFSPRLIAASTITAIVCLSMLAITAFNQTVISQKTAHLPAYSALSKGIVARESGDNNDAIEWFEFALIENPDSVESSLFLAETLYQQNRPEESKTHLQSVLKDVRLSAYNKATATNILSRISEQQGRFDDALRYAQNSLPADIVGQCSVDFIEQRVDRLKSEIAMSPTPSKPTLSELKQESLLAENYIAQCKQLNSGDAETSSCQAIENHGVAFIENNKMRTEKIS
jgi:DNA-binding winged helix-turn-helix (wHTH) protein